MKRVIVSVTNDLSTDQRVQKVCNTLINNNFEVFLIGRKLKNSVAPNLAYKTFRFNLLFNKGFLFYAEYNIRLFFKLLFLKKDILLANDLDTLAPNFLISIFFNKNLVYDSHELFTEVPELINRHFTRNFWLTIEKWILPNLNNCYTVSQSIATHYNTHYKTNFKLIRNLPIKLNIQKEKHSFIKHKSTIIYQGALNKGRGLELIIKTMRYLKKTHLLIIGSGDIELKLKNMVKKLDLNNAITFLPKQSPKNLKKITPSADIGISFEEDLGLNYRYALPNKLFDYIQAEIPVLVSNLPEMKAIVNNYKVGEVIKDRNPKNIAIQIEKILLAKNNYIKQLKLAKQELIWENEEVILLDLLKQLKY